MSGSMIKLIAIVAMLIDHVGATLYPEIVILRIVGRIAFPIFAFFIAEGYLKTRDKKKYMIRLFTFALVSEVPFDLSFFNTYLEFSHQNVFFTLAFAVLAMDLFDKYAEESQGKAMGYLYLVCLLSIVLKTDYNIIGIFMIFLFKQYRLNFKQQVVWVGGINLVMGLLGLLTMGTIEGFLQAFGVLAFIPLYFYNGKRGFSMKYLFYAFYPCHLIILFIMQGGNLL